MLLNDIFSFYCDNIIVRDIYHFDKKKYAPSQNALLFPGVLTYYERDNIDGILQTTFSNAFSWIKIVGFWFKFLWNLFRKI